MHVLMTADTVGGVWTYTRELVSGLIRRGHRITLVSFGKLPCTSQISWMSGLPGLDYRPTPFALEWMQDSAEDIDVSSEYLRQLIDEVKPDLLHFNQYAYGALKTFVPKIVVAHSDVFSWWVAVKGNEPPRDSWMDWYRETVCAGLEGADEVIAPSHWMMKNLERFYVRPSSGRVLYNGRDPSLFDAQSSKYNRVVSVGRIWDEAKQVTLLTKSAHAVPVLISGCQDHPDRTASPAAAEELPVGVTLCGHKTEPEIRCLLANSTIYAACSRYEPFGLAPVEAALSGCALVVNDIASFRELWGESACYFETNDAESLAHAIALLSNDRELAQEYSQRAYRHALRHFDAKHMVDRYEDLYAALLPQEAAA